jgi:hypothetical protein
VAGSPSWACGSTWGKTCFVGTSSVRVGSGLKAANMLRGSDGAGNQDCDDGGEGETHLGWFGSWSWKCDGGSERGVRFGYEGRLRYLSGVGDVW